MCEAVTVEPYLKYESIRIYHKQFQRKFPENPVPRRQNMCFLVSKLKAMGLLTQKTR